MTMRQILRRTSANEDSLLLKTVKLCGVFLVAAVMTQSFFGEKIDVSRQIETNQPLELLLKEGEHHNSSEVRIQIASDLHLEFYKDPSEYDAIVEPNAPILALLGDVGLSFTDTLRDFLFLQADRFEHVLFVAGNHEFYNRNPNKKYTVQEQMEWLRDVCDERDNIHFLERTALDIQGVRILGTALWSYIPPESVPAVEQSMNDYRRSYIQQDDSRGTAITQMTAAFTSAWYQKSRTWLEQGIQQAKDEDRPVIVLTHHTPSLEGTSKPEYKGSPVSCAFSSNLTHLLLRERPVVKAWACGHTHYNFDMTTALFEGGTRLVSNQRGYPSAVAKDVKYDSKGIVLKVLTKQPRT